MTSDFKKKEPSKTEKVLYELFMHQQHMDQNIATTSATVVAMSSLLNVDPVKVAELLVNGGDKLKEYSKKINDEIDRLSQEKKKNEPAMESKEDHNHEDSNHTH